MIFAIKVQICVSGTIFLPHVLDLGHYFIVLLHSASSSATYCLAEAAQYAKERLGNLVLPLAHYEHCNGSEALPHHLTRQDALLRMLSLVETLSFPLVSSSISF